MPLKLKIAESMSNDAPEPNSERPETLSVSLSPAPTWNVIDEPPVSSAIPLNFVCEAMRSGGLTKTRIVAMTGYGRPEDRQRAIEAGFDAFQVKPVAPPAIRELLAKMVG